MDEVDAVLFGSRNLHMTRGGYAAWSEQRDGVKRQRFVHRELMGLGSMAEDPIEVDHINGDRLDNRRANLRLATHQENGRNVGGRVGALKRVDRHGRGWRAQIKVNGETLYLGTFDTPEEAARAYDAAAQRAFGSFARLNGV